MKRRSTRLFAVSLALACGTTAAAAQGADAPFFDGTWSVRMQCKDGKACPARLVMSDFGGTWQDLSARPVSKRDCGGKKMPVTVQVSQRQLLAFTAWGDGVSAACPNYTVVVKPVDAKTMTGTADTDGKATESSEVHAGHPEASAGSAAAAASMPSTSRAIRLEKR